MSWIWDRDSRVTTGAVALVAGAACGAVLALIPAGAQAATITVNTTQDVHGTLDSCSLREAISSANTDGAVGNCAAGNGNDVILIPGGIYRLTIPNAGENTATGFDNTQGDLDIEDFATLRPRLPLDRVVIDGNGAALGDRVLHTRAAGGATLFGLTIRNGFSGFGGGIYNREGGVLTLNRVTVAGSSVTSLGGGLYQQDPASEVTILNSTFANNSARFGGGGLRVFGGAATLRNTTVAGNIADSDNNGSGDGGGIYAAVPVTLHDTLLAANTDRGAQAPDCDGTVTSAGQSLIGTPVGCTYTPGPGDVTGVAPRLRGLAFNGGTTATRALRSNSPARNRGNGCLATDQRGLPRGFGGRCDIGAYEYATCGAGVINRVGTQGANSITGTNGSDGVAALGGNDRVFTGPGGDWVCAGAGHDRVFTRAGVDRAFGQAGADRLFGGPARDFLFGNNGFDRLFGGSGGDRLFGGRLLDRMFGGPGFDRIFGAHGHDRAFGNAGNDYLNGANGRDRLFGGAGSDRMHGLGGSPDRCFGGGGFDRGPAFGCELVSSVP